MPPRQTDGQTDMAKFIAEVIPIILDLMSTMASPHVSKLKDFITMQLPSGFPVKIEIPLFHVLNACITFGNVFGMTTPVDNVTTINEDDRVTCIVDDRCFDIPSHYANRDHDLRRQMPLDEDDMLQYAIEQSLADTSGAGACALADGDKVDIWEALRGQEGVLLPDEDEQLQRVLQESLCNRLRPTGSPVSPVPGSQAPDIVDVVEDIDDDDDDDDDGGFKYMDPDLAMALRLSRQDQQMYELELKREQEMIEEALKLSLQEH